MLGSPLASPSVDTNSSSPFKDAPPTDRPYKDLTDRQTRYQKAVCVVNAPGKFAVTGTLLMCRGQCCVLFGDQANALVPPRRRPGGRRLYSNGGSESTAEAKLMPHLLWCPRAEFGLILCAVDGEPLRAPGLALGAVAGRSTRASEKRMATRRRPPNASYTATSMARRKDL